MYLPFRQLLSLSGAVATIGITCFGTRNVHVVQIKHFYILFSSATDRNDIAKQFVLFGVCNAD
jgi:hypothetical protein